MDKLKYLNQIVHIVQYKFLILQQVNYLIKNQFQQGKVKKEEKYLDKLT
jgi:hypothetical protein